MSTSSILYGRFSKIPKQHFPWGVKRTLFSRWGKLRLSGSLVEVDAQIPYEAWADTRAENICVVEEGSGALSFRGKAYPLRKGYAFKIFPTQQPVVRPRGRIVLLSVQMPGGAVKARRAGERLDKLRVVNPDAVPSKVYEFETLAEEIFTPAYHPGLGLIRFAFPLDAIPLHCHPHSGRLIRPIAGKGYTYAEPNIYEMKRDSFTLFPQGITHTNGPVPGNVIRLWAFQLPWVPSKIDSVNIAGSPRFVKYVGPTPPRKLWKTKEDFLRVLRRFSRSASPRRKTFAILNRLPS